MSSAKSDHSANRGLLNALLMMRCRPGTASPSR